MTEASNSVPQDFQVEGTARDKCPKCAYTRAPGSEECPACGVVFSRFRRPPEDPYRASSEIEADLADAGRAFNPYAPPTAAVGHAPLALGELELAERRTRLGAKLIDNFAFAIPYLAVLLPVTFASQGSMTTEGVASIWLGLAALLALALVQLRLLAKRGQTLGKRVTGIRIVRSSGETASLGRLVLLRFLVPTGLQVIPLVGPFFGLVNVLFVFREDRRCIHDHIADTIVITAPPAAEPPLMTVR